MLEISFTAHKKWRTEIWVQWEPWIVPVFSDNLGSVGGSVDVLHTENSSMHCWINIESEWTNDVRWIN